MTITERRTWLLSDPSTTLAEILDRAEAELGRAIVAHVGEDPEDVLAVRSLTLPVPYRGEDELIAHEAMHALREQLRTIAEEIVPGRAFADGGWAPMRGALITVVCREGYVVCTADEMQFHTAWRYSNHATAAVNGDVFAVTPHGWTSTITDACGLRPALRSPD